MKTAPQRHELDIEACRRRFPALDREVDGRPAVFLDGPGGSQVPQSVIDAVASYLTHTNANHAGLFVTSRESDAMLDAAHRAGADLFGADDGDLVVFGPNMTGLTMALSRALARQWGPGDEVLVTRLDHDANVAPWILAARDAGAVVRSVRFHPEDCTLDLDDLRSKLSPRTRLVAIACASNAVGTVNPVADVVRWVHEVGGLVYLDAVHYAPHRLMDVQAWNCDFAVCSAYKVFGPHVGMLWGRRELLETLPAYKVRPATEALPGRWMTGTQNHEGIAGLLAAVDYLAEMGNRLAPETADRRSALRAAFEGILAHEQKLSEELLTGLGELKSVRIWGVTDIERLAERVPTVSITHRRLRPAELAEHLARQGIFVWHGNYYALSLTEDLGLEPEGMVRIGLLHYNTSREVQRLLGALAELEN